jgi:hypothetical protein
MKKKLSLTLAALLLGWIVAGAWEKTSASGFVPLTAHVTQVAYGPDNTLPVTIVKVIDFRSDGSYRVSQTNVDHVENIQLTRVTLWDEQAGRKTVVSPGVRTTTSYKSNRAPLQYSCRQEILDAPEAGEFLGHRVVEIVREEDLEDGSSIRFQEWYAPELNCLQVYSEGKRMDADGNFLDSNIHRANAIVLGEPDPSLFVVPDNYSEVMPSELVRMEMENMFGENTRELPDLTGEDAHYFANAWPSFQ